MFERAERPIGLQQKIAMQFFDVDITVRRSPPEVFLEKGVLKIYSKFTGEYPCRSVISLTSLY